jgi:hypothetical protein
MDVIQQCCLYPSHESEVSIGGKQRLILESQWSCQNTMGLCFWRWTWTFEFTTGHVTTTPHFDLADSYMRKLGYESEEPTFKADESQPFTS